MTRKDDLATALEQTRSRIASACAAAGRESDDVTLVVVTKYFPSSDIALLYELGVRDVGESRHQEAEQKALELSELAGLRWHFIGHLQSNKAAAVSAYADVVHSVDRESLLLPLSKGAAAAGARRGDDLDVLVQVDLDPVPKLGRGGVRVDAALELARAVANADHLRLRGVMAVAPLGADPAAAFARLGEVASAVRLELPHATWISAGMSGDLEQAVAAGATHVRVGSAILGSRPDIR